MFGTSVGYTKNDLINRLISEYFVLDYIENLKRIVVSPQEQKQFVKDIQKVINLEFDDLSKDRQEELYPLVDEMIEKKPSEMEEYFVQKRQTEAAKKAQESINQLKDICVEVEGDEQKGRDLTVQLLFEIFKTNALLVDGKNTEFSNKIRMFLEGIVDDKLDISQKKRMLSLMTGSTKEGKSKVVLLRQKLFDDFRAYNSSSTLHSRYADKYSDQIRAYVKDCPLAYDFQVKSDMKSKQFRENLRRKCNSDFKPLFYQMCGAFLRCGAQIASDKNLQSVQENAYQTYKNCLKKALGTDDIEAELDKNFNIASDIKDKEAARYNAFKDKSEEMYYKTLAALMCQKAEVKQDGCSGFVSIFDRYIQHLYASGYNNLLKLNFLSPEDIAAEGNIHDTTTEKKVITLHHNGVSIGAAYDVLSQISPIENLSDAEKLERASEVVNHYGNCMFVVGKQVHASLEPSETIYIRKDPEQAVFASRIDLRILDKMFHSMSVDEKKMLKAGFEKYIPGYKDYADSKKTCRQEVDLRVNLPRSESRLMENCRRSLQSLKKREAQSNLKRTNTL